MNINPVSNSKTRKLSMSENENIPELNQQFSHNTEVALAALKRLCLLGDSLEEISANQQNMIDYNFQFHMIAANTNKNLNTILKQLSEYMMMQKSEEFKKLYLSLVDKSKS